jgi:hypothetical protein
MISCRPLELMANAGAEYMVKAKAKGSNPGPPDSLSWVPLTDLVAIRFWKLIQAQVTDQYDIVLPATARDGE